MEIADFLSNLKIVATSPYAFAGYVAVVAAWVYTSVARHRLSKVADVLTHLPADQRQAVLLREYDTAPRGGMTPEHWITSRRHMLVFLAFLAAVICGTVILVIALTVPGDREGMADAHAMQRIEELETRLQRAEETAMDLQSLVSSLTGAGRPDEVITLLAEINSRYERPDPRVDALLGDPSLTSADKATLASMQTLKRLDGEIRSQAEAINRLQREADPSGPSIDVETMKLKRLIDRRSQTFDMLRQVIDRHNQTAKGIIDSMGR